MINCYEVAEMFTSKNLEITGWNKYSTTRLGKCGSSDKGDVVDQLRRCGSSVDLVPDCNCCGPRFKSWHLLSWNWWLSPVKLLLGGKNIGMLKVFMAPQPRSDLWLISCTMAYHFELLLEVPQGPQQACVMRLTGSQVCLLQSGRATAHTHCMCSPAHG